MRKLLTVLTLLLVGVGIRCVQAADYTFVFLDAASAATQCELKMNAESQRELVIDEIADLSFWPPIKLAIAREKLLHFPSNLDSLRVACDDDAEAESAVEQLAEYVSLGEPLIPWLLEHLSDKRRTKIIVSNHEFGELTHDAFEIDSNPAFPQEVKACRLIRGMSKKDRVESSYTLTVGDVCYWIFGQIVGRDFQPVAVRPTAIFSVHSFSDDDGQLPIFKEHWDARLQNGLCDSLIKDHQTRVVSSTHVQSAISIGTDWQVSAVSRLVFYFPDESKKLIDDRLAEIGNIVETVNRSNPSLSEREKESAVNIIALVDCDRYRKASRVVRNRSDGAIHEMDGSRSDQSDDRGKASPGSGSGFGIQPNSTITLKAPIGVDD